MEKIGFIFYAFIVFISGFTFYIYLNLPIKLPLKKPSNLNYSFIYQVERLIENKKNHGRKNKIKKQIINPLKNCKLLGVIYPKMAFLNCNEKIKLLKIKEKVSNCILVKIKKNKVIFNCNNISATLYLLKEKTNLNKKKRYSPNYQDESKNVFYVNRKQVIDLISSGKIFYQMAVTPYYRNGKIIGFRVNGVKRNSFVYKMGIRRGDIILSVNDYPIRSMEEGFAAFERLKNASEINIKILRHGREVTLSYVIED